MSQSLDNVEDVYPLSPLQEGMLFHAISGDVPGAFVNQVCVELVGAVDPAVLQRAWTALVQRHPALRTVFLWDGLDEPLQVVREQAPAELQVVDGPAGSPERLDAWLQEDIERGFALDEAPPSRLTLLVAPGAPSRLVWTHHHLIADGWSVQTLLTELIALYADERVTLPPAPRFRDIIAWHKAADAEGDRRFWTEELRDAPRASRLEIPGRPPHALQRGHRATTFRLSPAVSEGLRARAKRAGVTLNTVVLGGWTLLLSRWTAQSDLVVGATVSTRPASIAHVERIVGPLINTLALRVTVDETSDPDEWLRGLQARQGRLSKYERTPLAVAQRAAGTPAGEALFDSIFVFENVPPRADGVENALRLGATQYHQRSNYPLAVLVLPEETLEVTFIYDCARFSEEGLEQLAATFTRVLEGLTERQHAALKTIPWGLPSQIVGPDLHEAGGLAHAAIEAWATKTPEAVAVDGPAGTLTYRDLDARAGSLAASLIERGVVPGTPVGLCVDRSPEMIVGIVGILKAGAGYVPLDPTYPRHHLNTVVATDGIEIVVTGAGAPAFEPSVRTVPIPPQGGRTPIAAPAVTGDHLAYVIFTSGSTGRAKGVMVTHDNVVRSTSARTAYYGASPGRFLLLSSFAFDSSVAGIFWALTGGGTLVLPAVGAEHDAGQLAHLIRTHEVSHLLGLPSLYEALLDNADATQLAPLRVAIVAGEACPPSTVAAHRTVVPQAELHNEYGPTEATVWCTAMRLDTDQRPGPPPIGRPIPGVTVGLQDALGRPVPTGFAGELWVGGPTVAAGYLNQPEATAERFIFAEGSPPRYRTGDLACVLQDGSLRFLGRKDAQIKVRGHRIETGAVEAALRAHAAVADAAALTAVLGRSAQLVAYVVPAGRTLSDAELRAHLQDVLPKFMVPDVFVTLDALPRLPNGKVDTRALPAPDDPPATAFVAPVGRTEEILAGVWAALLGVDRVGRHDNYFALGGDSIISIHMVSRARREGVSIEPSNVARHPTLAALAATAKADAHRVVGTDRVSGDVPLGAIQRWFLGLDAPSPSHWNQAALFELPPDTEEAALRDALAAAVEQHDMLRARFVKDAQTSAWRQSVDAEVRPFDLEVLQDAGPEAEAAAMAQAHASLSLAGGGLARGLLLRRADAVDALFVVIHHLVVDIVSWSILGEDLKTAYSQRMAGNAIRLPERTTSFRAYVERLEAEDRRQERALWAGLTHPVPLPSDIEPPAANTEAHAASVHFDLDERRTQQLLTRANEPYRTRADELVVAGIAVALAEWTGQPTVHLALESHGRDGAGDDVDLSRTVGWFSAVYPVVLSGVQGEAVARTIKMVKEQLRAVPGAGVGYGVLRAVDPALRDRPEPEVLVNYHGRGLRPPDDARFIPRVLADAAARHPDAPRGHAVEVIGFVRDGELTLDWTYNRRRHHRATIERVAQRALRALQAIVDHCMNEDAGGLTPSDAPGTGLDQDALDSVLDELTS